MSILPREKIIGKRFQELKYSTTRIFVILYDNKYIMVSDKTRIMLVPPQYEVFPGDIPL